MADSGHYSFRNEARQAAIKKRKQETDKEDETQEYFIAEFIQQKKHTDDLLTSLSVIPKEALKSKFDEIAVSLNALIQLISDSALFLPPHTIRSYRQKITELQLLASKREDELFPKQKFSFKTRTKKTTTSETIKPDTRPLPEIGPNDDYKIALSNTLEVKERTNDIVTLQSDKVNGNDVNLSDLSNCTVKIRGSAGTLTVSKCQNTKIFTGPVQGSIFIEDCTSCSFIVACQQLRVHSSTNSVFYLHVVSRAIIEDSTNLRFAPYNWQYPSQEDHYLLSGLSLAVNNWDKIDDFNWLSSKEHSPNWSLIPETQRWDNDDLCSEKQ